MHRHAYVQRKGHNDRGKRQPLQAKERDLGMKLNSRKLDLGLMDSTIRTKINFCCQSWGEKREERGRNGNELTK
jgi:hypothetical protein